LAAGLFSLLPLGQRVAARIEGIIRSEIDGIGGQEMKMPVVHPAELWRESGRYDAIGDELGRFSDRNGRDMVLAMTHEEVVTDLARREIKSYRQLPQLIYHFQTKWRDDPRPRAGLIRVREFTMKDSYSLDATWEGLDKQYDAHFAAYQRIYARCELPVVAVKSDTGMMGGKEAHEFMVLTPIGEDTLILCSACGYTANRQVARLRKPAAPVSEALPLERVATPHTPTIAALAELLGIAPSQTAKAVFLVADLPEPKGVREQFVFVVMRGDMDLNETKLGNALASLVGVPPLRLRPAREEEIRSAGAEPGYASPIGLKDVLVIVDDAVPASPNLVAGANEAGYHLRHTNYGRDYTAALVTDLAAADAGCACPECGEPVRAERGVEVGNIFKLGTRYSEALGATFLDADGQTKPIIMGSYGIGVGRLMACIVERHHDGDGLIWPETVAPYRVHLVRLPGGEEIAERVYTDLHAAGIDVLFDDRDDRAGVKFKDADLMGLPIRVTLGERALKSGGAEVKFRNSGESRIVPLSDLVDTVRP
jgi:prolyl-tRNA synthetase